MGGKTWSPEEERYFWTSVVPYSSQRTGVHVANSERSWGVLAAQMKRAMGDDTRRDYNDQLMFEHFYQNVHSGRISPHASKYVHEYMVRAGLKKNPTGSLPASRSGNNNSGSTASSPLPGTSASWEHRDGRLMVDFKISLSPTSAKFDANKDENEVTQSLPKNFTLPDFQNAERTYFESVRRDREAALQGPMNRAYTLNKPKVPSPLRKTVDFKTPEPRHRRKALPSYQYIPVPTRSSTASSSSAPAPSSSPNAAMDFPANASGSAPVRFPQRYTLTDVQNAEQRGFELGLLMGSQDEYERGLRAGRTQAGGPVRTVTKNMARIEPYYRIPLRRDPKLKGKQSETPQDRQQDLSVAAERVEEERIERLKLALFGPLPKKRPSSGNSSNSPPLAALRKTPPGRPKYDLTPAESQAGGSNNTSASKGLLCTTSHRLPFENLTNNTEMKGVDTNISGEVASSNNTDCPGCIYEEQQQQQQQRNMKRAATPYDEGMDIEDKETMDENVFKMDHGAEGFSDIEEDDKEGGDKQSLFVEQSGSE